jgi:hypothetical protein
VSSVRSSTGRLQERGAWGKDQQDGQRNQPGVADAREAPGGDGEVVWRATPAGVFRTWIGQTPAECESLEHMHLDLEQEMEEEERECARLRKTTWVPGSVDDEVSDWTAPAGIGEAYDWSLRARALLAEECSPQPSQVPVLTGESGARAPTAVSDVPSQRSVVTEWQGTRVLRQPEENVSGSPDYRITPSEKGGAPTRTYSQGDQNHHQPQHQPTRRSQRPSGGRPVQTSCTPCRLCRLFKPFKTTENKTLEFRSREVGDVIRPIKLTGIRKEPVQLGEKGGIFNV